jgi:hypothetical protein
LIRTAESAAKAGASAWQQYVGTIFLRGLEFFRRDCIQSLRFGVMLAERKKWKLANNVSAELPGNAAEKFGFLS